MSSIASTIRRVLREQRGSYVAQTAGIALFVAVVIGLLFSAMPSMRGSVQALLECEIAKYSGGGRCGSGGGAKNGPGPNWQNHNAAPINQNQPTQPQPQPTVAPAPRSVAPAPENQPVPVADRQPVEPCRQGLAASALGGGGSIPLSRMPTTPGCDARC